MIEWADFIFVMERAHRNKVQKRFGKRLDGKPIVCLGIPDEFDFMDAELVHILEARMARHLP